MLKMQDLDVYYGESQALYGVSLRIGKGEIVTVLGRNGAGKTTLIKTIAGITKPRQGSIELDGRNITGMPLEKRAASGVAYVPDDKRIFPQLTVLENLQLSAIGARLKLESSLCDRVLQYFPALTALLSRKAGNLSGGERQMLAIARALLRRPLLALLDEASQGLAPFVVERLKDAVLDFRRDFGTSFLVVEQEMKFATSVADRIYGLLTGSVVYEGTPKEFFDTEAYSKFLVIV